eukprot:Awhi_evm1s1128
MDKKRVITLFSGIGCQEMSLDNLGIDYEVVNWCEFDKKVSDCYKIIHNVDDSRNIGDITKLDIDKYNETDIDLLTCSFPCCSFSQMGKKEGFDCDKNGNLFDISYRLIEKVKPKVVLFENVKGIKNPKFKGDIHVRNCMEDIGYKCFDKVLNSVNYNVPQSRDRWFVVCVLDNDIDFQFPEKIPLSKFVKDIIDIDDTERDIPLRLVPYLDRKLHIKKYKSQNGVIKLFDGYSDGTFKSVEGTCPTLTTGIREVFIELGGNLNSLERCRLMGLKDDVYYKLKKEKVSKATFTKITGNGIVTRL